MAETHGANALNSTRDHFVVGRNGPDDEVGAGRPKAAKACVNCRKQKMKCIPSNDAHSCRRCLRTGVPCIFVPRANAATLPEGLLAAGASSSLDEHFKNEVLRRLRALESAVASSQNPAGNEQGILSAVATIGSSGTSTHVPVNHEATEDFDSASETSSPLPAAYASLAALWEAVSVLRETAPASVPRRIWKRVTIGDLWLAFHERMPGLHFMPRKQTFSIPQPLLVASILYCSSIRGPPAVAADLAPHYFVVLCNAIAQLSVPGSAIGRPHGPAGSENCESTPSEEWAFQTVLGIVLAGLLAEGSERVTGLWISIAYRLILEHCPADQTYMHSNGGGREWRKLFSGVQIVDLEHASLHLSCPVIPIESPLPMLNIGFRDQLYRLSRMMHTGLTHFTGRGLPTIWSVFTGGMSGNQATTAAATFTPVDAAIIRDWAHQLDAWLVEFSNTPPESSRSASADQDRKLVYRQYVLHRLVVLSIYHPARGCDLWSNSITPQEQHELLPSARATLKLHLHDDSIWSNWDLVMISWAALIVIQGVEGGMGEVDDLANIRIHLEMLKRMNEPKSKLCDRLVVRLEQSLQGVNTPDVNMNISQSGFVPSEAGADGENVVYSEWQIFDQSSLRDIPFPTEWS